MPSTSAASEEEKVQGRSFRTDLEALVCSRGVGGPRATGASNEALTNPSMITYVRLVRFQVSLGHELFLSTSRRPRRRSPDLGMTTQSFSPV